MEVEVEVEKDGSFPCPHCGERLRVVASSGVRPRWARRLSRGWIVGLTCGFVGALLLVWFAAGVGTDVEASCEVGVQGWGACEFENEGWSPGGGCVVVRLFNAAEERAESDEVCSGYLMPGAGARRDVRVRLPPGHCEPEPFSSRASACDVVVVPRY